MEKCECGRAIVRCPFCHGAMHLSSEASDLTVGVCSYCAGYVTTLRDGSDVRIKLLKRSEFETLPADTRAAMEADRRRVMATWT